MGLTYKRQSGPSSSASPGGRAGDGGAGPGAAPGRSCHSVREKGPKRKVRGREAPNRPEFEGEAARRWTTRIPAVHARGPASRSASGKGPSLPGHPRARSGGPRAFSLQRTPRVWHLTSSLGAEAVLRDHVRGVLRPRFPGKAFIWLFRSPRNERGDRHSDPPAGGLPAPGSRSLRVPSGRGRGGHTASSETGSTPATSEDGENRVH